MFERKISKTLQKAVSSFPVTALTGPRQSGKTLLLKTLFPEHRYINLESPETLFAIKNDPKGYFAQEGSWIVDEAQNYPELFSYIQVIVDEKPQPGQFILSGSQNFLLSEKMSQTLAGRVAVLELLPLSYDEYLSHPDFQALTVWEFLYQGGYPRPYQEHLDLDLWYDSYMRTYLERDVRNVLKIRDLNQFQLFLKLCAGRHGQLLNLNELATSCGISQTTATHWLNILEASYILFRLKPYYRNFNKRLVKTPKLYFYDSALVCKLLGIDSVEHLQFHSARGAIFEGFALTQVVKTYLALGKQAPLYFWRDHSGDEVDGLIEFGDSILALEIKSGMTITSGLFKSLKRWNKITKNPSAGNWLIYAGDETLWQHDTEVLPWHGIEQNLEGLLLA